MRDFRAFCFVELASMKYWKNSASDAQLKTIAISSNPTKMMIVPNQVIVRFDASTPTSRESALQSVYEIRLAG